MKKKNKNKKSIVVVALLLMVGISTYFVAGTYAKYTAEVSGTGTADVAKWAFTDDNNQVTLNIDYDGTYDPTTLVNKKLAPGTQGFFKVKISNATSEVGVDFKVTPETITGAPTNVKFYKDAQYSVEFDASHPITGKIAVGEDIDVKIYWKWEYETGAVDSTTEIAAGDAQDTTDGKTITEFTVPIKIRGFQTEPGAAIETKID